MPQNVIADGFVCAFVRLFGTGQHKTAVNPFGVGEMFFGANLPAETI
jgi:hypothetical protein